jgi:pyruvate ferredoxin oxidoreductase gamma subunit
MLEIRIHGRGGQGNVVAAYLLAATAVEAGLYAQAFPAFGAERRGAPVAAFVRCARHPVRRRCEVRTPDIVVVQDLHLLADPDTLAGLAGDGCVLVNGGKGDLPPPAGFPAERWCALAASTIAEERLGRRLPNTALLGALVALTALAPPAALAAALEQRFPPETASRNVAAAAAAAAAVPAAAWQDLANARGLRG